MSNFAIYARQSSEPNSKSEVSIEEQFASLIALCEKRMHSERIKRGILAKKLAAKKK